MRNSQYRYLSESIVRREKYNHLIANSHILRNNTSIPFNIVRRAYGKYHIANPQDDCKTICGCSTTTQVTYSYIMWGRNYIDDKGVWFIHKTIKPGKRIIINKEDICKHCLRKLLNRQQRSR